MDKEVISTVDIQNALLRKHERDFCIFEVTTGRNLSGRIDCIVMKMSWAHPRLDAYEIKSSRRDFLNDEKWMKYLPYCNYFSFICPSGLIQKEEVSEGVGLYWVTGKSRKIMQKKKPVYRDTVDPLIYKRIIMSKLRTDRYPFHSSKAEYFRDWLEHKKSNRELGYQVRTRLVKEVIELEEKVIVDKLSNDKIDKVREVLLAAGYRGYDVVSAVRNAINDKNIVKYSEQLVDSLHQIVHVSNNILEDIKENEESNEKDR